MKVLIIPHYLYTHLNAFKIIEDNLRYKGVTVKYFYIKGQESNDNINKKEFLEINSNNLIITPTLSIKRRNKLFRCIHFFKYIINFFIIGWYLKKEKCDLAIIGSDTGGIYIRFIQEILIRAKIPIVILQIMPFKPTNNRKELEIPLNKIIQLALNLFSLGKIFTFNGDIPGTYKKNSYVFTLGESSRKIICSTGKDLKYVLNGGNPEFDHLTNVIPKINLLDFLNENGLDSNYNYIVYFTETLQEVFGKSYLLEINDKLYKILRDLPENYRVIIKFHPREPFEIIEMFRNKFSDNRFIFLNKTNNSKLIQISFFCIAHYSAILFNVALLSKPFMSINLLSSSNYFDFPCSLLVKNENEIKEWIHNIIENEEFKISIIDCINNWSKENIYNSQTFNSSETVTAKLISIIKESKKI